MNDMHNKLIGSKPKKTLVSNNKFVIAGFNFLVLFWILYSFFPSNGFTLEKVGISALLILSVAFFALEIISGFKIRVIDSFHGFPKLMLFGFLIWCAITIARGALNISGNFLTLVAHPEIGALVWLLPLLVFLGRRPSLINSLAPTFYYHNIVGIIFIVILFFSGDEFGSINNKSPFAVGLMLIYAAPLILLTKTGSQRDQFVSWLALIIAVPANYYMSSRAGFTMSTVLLFFSILTYSSNSYSSLKNRLFFGSAFFLLMALFSYDYILNIISDEWLIDTRTFLFEEMNDDFSITDWLIGRGALGSYFSPYFYNNTRLNLEGDWFIRQVNEIGFLHIALKMGLIGVFFYASTILSAVIKLICNATDRMSFAVVIILSLHLVELMVVGQAVMSPQRVLLWILVGAALSFKKNNAERKI